MSQNYCTFADLEPDHKLAALTHTVGLRHEEVQRVYGNSLLSQSRGGRAEVLSLLMNNVHEQKQTTKNS